MNTNKTAKENKKNKTNKIKADNIVGQIQKENKIMKNVKNKGVTENAVAESIEAQREMIIKFAEANNIDILEWHIDCASGTSADTTLPLK
ncbi:MAG: recombinase family protein [Firmicutes bacterium]|nr:recombinase family protein [Bacillota bacterium]